MNILKVPGRLLKDTGPVQHGYAVDKLGICDVRRLKGFADNSKRRSAVFLFTRSKDRVPVELRCNSILTVPESISDSSSDESWQRAATNGRLLDVSGPVKPYTKALKNFWYPVLFSDNLDATTLVSLKKQTLSDPCIPFALSCSWPGRSVTNLGMYICIHIYICFKSQIN